MARISASDARRLGLKIKGDTASIRNSGKTEIAKTSAAKGREVSRIDRIRYPDETITIVLDLPFDPKPKERPRTVMNVAAVEKAFFAAKGRIETFRSLLGKGTSRTFTPKSTRDYEELISIAATHAMRSRPPLRCPVEVKILFILKGSPDKWPTSAADGDSDNMEKAVLDALNGIAFSDDRLVVRCLKEKACGPKSGLKIEIRPADPAPFAWTALVQDAPAPPVP